MSSIRNGTSRIWRGVWRVTSKTIFLTYKSTTRDMSEQNLDDVTAELNEVSMGEVTGEVGEQSDADVVTDTEQQRFSETADVRDAEQECSSQADDKSGLVQQKRSSDADEVAKTVQERSIEINNEGVRYFLNRQFDKAEACYSEALNLDPESVAALNNMGLLNHQKGEYRQAIQYFEKANRISPSGTYCVNAGNASTCLKEMEEAVYWYQKALEINRNSVSARESLANLYEYMGEARQAADLWIDLANTTREETYRLKYAQNLISRKEFTEAADILYNHTSGSDHRTWYLAGLCEFQQKNYGLAVKALNRGLAIAPDHEETRRYLAVTYIKMGEIRRGLDQMDKMIRMNPDNYEILTEKGVILLSIHEPDKALKLFEESLAIKPGYKKAEKYRTMARKIVSKRDI